MHLPETAVLLLVDVQQGFFDPAWPPSSNPRVGENIAALLDAWRRGGRPVVHVQHLSQRQDSVFFPDKPGVNFQDVARPAGDEPVFTKRVNSAFVGTGLEDFLRARGNGPLVIVGLSTDHCVSSTARAAADLGFQVYVVDDATATHDRHDPQGRVIPAEQVHRVSLASLHGEFATVVRTADVLAAVVPPIVA